MSYDTFSNSAYLRQGQADQFVQQTPVQAQRDPGRHSGPVPLRPTGSQSPRADEVRPSAEATDLERDVSGIDAELLRYEPELREQLDGAASPTQEGSRHSATGRTEGRLGRHARPQDSVGGPEAVRRFAAGANHRAGFGDRRLPKRTVRAPDAEAGKANALLSRQEEICRDFEKLTAAREKATGLEKDVEQFYRGQQLLAAAEKELMAAESEVQWRMKQTVGDFEAGVRRASATTIC